MKRKFIFKLIAGGVVSTTLFTGMPLKAEGAWKQDNQGNYYFDEGNGYSSGWRNIDGKVYYFNDSGVMQKGWINYDGSWYFLDNAGTLKTGWINFNNNWYYSDSAGRMQSGIISVNGKIYYLAENGVMQTKNTIINNQFYTIGSDGVIVGSNIPTPNRVYDMSGNCIQSDSSSNNINVSPIESMNSQPTVDHSEVGDYSAPTRKFTIKFRSYDGEELESKTVKEGNTVKAIDADSRDGYEFVEWNTKSDGSGKSYDEGDKIKANSDMNLYPIYKKDEEVIPINSIVISGEKEVEIGKEIQLSAEVKPSSATDTKVKWSVTNNGGEATIDSNGSVKGVKEGEVIVKAEAQDKSGESAEYRIKVVQAKTIATQITIKGASNVIDTNGGTIQLTAEIKPDNVSNTDVKWEIEGSGSKYASISSNGLLTAIADGELDVIAHAKDGSGVSSEKYHVKITNQKVKPSYIIVSGSKNEDSVAIGKGTIQMKANVDKIGQTDNVKWSVDNTDIASIDENTGKLEGHKKGSVTVTAKYDDGIKVLSGTKKISVVQPVESIIIKDMDTKLTSGFAINKDRGIINFGADVIGTASSEPNNKGITWSIVNDFESSGGKAFLDNNGKLTALKDGKVNIIATANDGYGATTSAAVTISNQKVATSEIKLYDAGENDITDTSDSKTPLELISNVTTQSAVTIKAVADDKATDKTIVWSLLNNNQYVDANLQQHDEVVDGKVVSSTVTITAKNPTLGDNFVTIRAASKDGSVSVTKQIKIKKNISSLQFNEDSRDEIVGTTIDVYALIHDSDATNKDIEWKVEPVVAGEELCASIEVSDKPQVTTINGVTASKQKIHLNKVGTVKVTATAKDGSGVQTSKSLKINIKPAVTGISISSSVSGNTINKGDSVELTASVKPDNTIQDVEWYLEDPAGIAELSANGNTRTLVANSVGTVKVIAKAKRAGSDIDSATKEFTIIDPTANNSGSTNSSNSSN